MLKQHCVVSVDQIISFCCCRYVMIDCDKGLNMNYYYSVGFCALFSFFFAERQLNEIPLATLERNQRQQDKLYRDIQNPFD